LGLAYDSSLIADESCYELLLDGEPTGVVAGRRVVRDARRRRGLRQDAFHVSSPAQVPAHIAVLKSFQAVRHRPRPHRGPRAD